MALSVHLISRGQSAKAALSLWALGVPRRALMSIKALTPQSNQCEAVMPTAKVVKMDPTEVHIEEPAPTAAKSEVWKRGLIMLVFMFAFGVGQSILYLTAVAQFLWLLLAKEPNQLLVGFGKSLGLWLAETAKFLCCATDEKPFPWKSWPVAD
jgi:hypothetical protein